MNNPEVIRIAIVEDHPLFLDLLVSSLTGRPGIEVSWAVSTVTEARARFSESPVDVVVLDVELQDGNGVSLGISLSREYVNLGVVLLSNLSLEDLLAAPYLEDKKSWSFLSKRTVSSVSALVEVVKLSAQGQGVVDPAFFRRTPIGQNSLEAILTARQFQILEMVSQGKANSEIGAILGIAQNSVINHLSAIYSALEIPKGANSRVAAVLRFLAETNR